MLCRDRRTLAAAGLRQLPRRALRPRRACLRGAVRGPGADPLLPAAPQAADLYRALSVLRLLADLGRYALGAGDGVGRGRCRLLHLPRARIPVLLRGPRGRTRRHAGGVDRAGRPGLDASGERCASSPRSGGKPSDRRLHGQLHPRHRLHLAVAAAGHRAGAWPPIEPADHQGDLHRLHRVHPRCAADHAAVRGIGDAGLLPAARRELRPASAGHHHDHALRRSLHRRGDPRRAGRLAQGPVRGRREFWASTTGNRCG